MAQDNSRAVISLVLAVFFWIPLLNIPIAIASIYMGIRALKNIRERPQHYSGRKYAVAAITISAITLAFTAGAFILRRVR
ncbi:DUF4190 domain-containing protein [Candidatus Woesearchaeota archaeon]|nr:DUF4190 domain-containing protein [Candidatus Woesearchaeota archaeon]